MRSSPFVPAALAACATLACQAFAPTIPQRQGDSGLAPRDVQVSLGEEYPEELATEAQLAARETPPVEFEAAYVAPHVGDDELLQVEFRNAPLAQVVHFIAERAGLNVYIDPTIDRTVDVSFKSITLDAALQSVLGRNGLRLIEDPPGVYWIEVHDGTQAQMASFTVQSIDAADVLDNLKALIDATSTIVVDSKQNLIVVRGRQADIDIVRDYLGRADRLQRQVLIEVRILEVTLGDRFQLGIAGDAAGSIDGHLFNLMQDLSTADDSFTAELSSKNGDVNATINAMRRLAGTDLVSSPRVLALTGMQASVEVVQEVPYVNVTSTQTGTTGGIGTSVVEEVQFKEAGIKLKVTPTIQEGGSIHIAIDQELSEVVDTFRDIPVIDKRYLKTDFLVRDRATVVLGGLMQNKRTEVDKGVPGLMDIPLLGRLFRHDDDQLGKRELLVFLTPRIVDAHEAAQLTSTFKRVYTERVRADGVHATADER